MKNKANFITQIILVILWIICLIVNIIAMEQGIAPRWSLIIIYNAIIILNAITIAVLNI